MSVQRERTLFCLAALLFASATAWAVPTADVFGSVLVAEPEVGHFQFPARAEIVETADLELAAIGCEITQPSSASEVLPVAFDAGVKVLPAVPTTLLLVITGFFCVSFIRDRRVWLAGFTGQVWLGHAGACAVPQLAHHLCRPRHLHRQFTIQSFRTHPIENSDRSRCDIEDTEYIGLLRHLVAIPPTRSVSRLNYQSEFCDSLERTEDNFRSTQFAIGSLSSRIICAVNCSTRPVEQIIYFSPAFIFDNLARGPPEPIRKVVFQT